MRGGVKPNTLLGPLIPDNTGILLSRNPGVEKAFNEDISQYPYPFNLEGKEYLQSRWKRTLDVAMATVTSPAWVSISLGAALYMLPDLGITVSPIMRQRRYGIGWDRFGMYKIRTQLKDTSATGEINPTERGAFLRRNSIDEFPQFANVLDGSMSFVGRRPMFPVDTRSIAARLLVSLPFDIAVTSLGFTKEQWDSGELDEQTADQIRDLTDLVRVETRGLYRRFKLNNVTKPGITGLQQISGRRDMTTEDRVAVDLLYDERASISRDIAIIQATPRVVLSRNGAR